MQHKYLGKDLEKYSVSEVNFLETKKIKLKTPKEVDSIYKNAFSIQRRTNSNRIKVTDTKIRNLSMNDITIRDENIELKQSLNKFKGEVSLLKTALKKSQGELQKELNTEYSLMDTNHLKKQIKLHKATIQSLKEELKTKDEAIESHRKKVKYCQINELEVEINLLTEERKNLMKIIEELSNNRQLLVPDTQEDDIQKTILISQLRKEKESLLYSLEEKNQEILKWRERVIDLENKEENLKTSRKKDRGIKIKKQEFQIKKLKTQIKQGKKNHEILEKYYEEQLERLQFKQIAEKHSPKSQSISDRVLFTSKPLTNLNPVPFIMHYISDKISRENMTLESLFHQMTLSFSNMPTIKDLATCLFIPKDHQYILLELAHYFNLSTTISLVMLKNFCHASKFTPVSIQKILQHLTFKLQLHKISRHQVSELFSPLKAHDKSAKIFSEILSRSPFELESSEISNLVSYLFQDDLSALSYSHISMAIPVRLGTWSLVSSEDEILYKNILIKLIEENKIDLLSHCKLFDKKKNGVITDKEFLKAFELSHIKIERNLERYIIAQLYSQKKELNSAEYIKFFNDFNTISDEINPDKIVDYYICQISEKLQEKKLSIEKVFTVKKNLITGEDFLEGLSLLDLDSITESHLGVLLESLQSVFSTDLCIDFSILQQKLSLFRNTSFEITPQKIGPQKKIVFESGSNSPTFMNRSSQHLSENSIFTLSP